MQSNIRSEGFRSLREGEPVEFEVEAGTDGRAKAINVTGPEGQAPQVRARADAWQVAGPSRVHRRDPLDWQPSSQRSREIKWLNPLAHAMDFTQGAPPRSTVKSMGGMPMMGPMGGRGPMPERGGRMDMGGSMGGGRGFFGYPPMPGPFYVGYYFPGGEGEEDAP